MIRFRSLFILLIGNFSVASVALSQELDLESMRPKVLFKEDFETYAEGSEDIGSTPLEIPWPTSNPGVATIQSRLVSDGISSKQLVTTGGKLYWSSKWTRVEQAEFGQNEAHRDGDSQ
ncbi:MAG: hypothetical protein ACI8T1_000930 [Verrucomicrobiales bacterium]|jgi:hypothetical protein